MLLRVIRVIWTKILNFNYERIDSAYSKQGTASDIECQSNGEWTEASGCEVTTLSRYFPPTKLYNPNNHTYLSSQSRKYSPKALRRQHNILCPFSPRYDLSRQYLLGTKSITPKP